MQVHIIKPAKNAMQSGQANGDFWHIRPNITETQRPNTLMGWISSANTTSQIDLKFPTQEEAIAYATKKSWTYTIIPSQNKRIQPKSYAANFTKDRPIAG